MSTQHPFKQIPLFSTICFVLSIVLLSHAHAETKLPIELEAPYGLAMVGTPKYDASAAHLDYASPDAPKGGTLKMSAIGTFDTLNPYSIKGKAAEGLHLVYDRLMARVWDEPFTMYPLIAEKVEVADDRSWIAFTLNPKARFKDGTPITVDDVIFSYETLRDSGRPNMRQVYKLVQSAEKEGERRVKFTLGEGYDRETVMILAMMPVLSKDWWSGRTFDATTLGQINTNGPYTIETIDVGRRIVYKRDPDYWAKDLPVNVGHFNPDTIIYDYYRDGDVAFEAFKSGDADFRREFDVGRWADGYDFPAIKNGTIKKEAIAHSRPEKARAFIFNTRRAPFDDIRVREAFNLLFDYEWVNKNLFHGKFKRITSFYPNSELAAHGTPSAAELSLLESYRDTFAPPVFETAYTPPVSETPQQRRTNMRKAAALLDASGWTVQNGKRMKDGNPLSFEILLGAPEDEKIALHLSRALEKAGIDVKIRVLDTAAYRGRLNEYDFDMTLYHWLSSLSPGTEQVLYWGCEAAKQPARWNFAGICNPAVDALAGNIAHAETREDLVAHVRALDRILTHGQYVIPLYYAGEDYVSYAAKIRHPAETPLYGMVLETWWIDTAHDQ